MVGEQEEGLHSQEWDIWGGGQGDAEGGGLAWERICEAVAGVQATQHLSIKGP